MRNLSPEKKALLFIALVVLCSTIARAMKARDALSVHAGTLDLQSFAQRTDSAVRAGKRKAPARPKASRKKGPPRPIELRTATAEELARLPGLTPTLADRILAVRDEKGRLTLDDIAAIPGVGRRKADALRPFLRDVATRQPLLGYQPPEAGGAEADRGRPLQRNGGPRAAPRSAAVNVNRATRQELESLPGIGPSLAERILAERQKRGRFASLAEFDSVPGIGPAMLKRLEPLLRF